MRTKVFVTVSLLAILLVSCVPNNHFIVYSASSDETSVNLYLVNIDSGENQQITDLKYANYPSWSPDGKKIVFSSRDGLYFMSSGNKADLTKIIDTPNFEMQPIWSPDGSKVAFISQNVDDQSLYDLMVVNIDGTRLVTLAKNLGEIDYFSSFSWSPNGEKLTFSNPVNEGREIFTINADGTGLTQVTNLSAPPYSPPTQPSWSPDGKKIAFVTFDLFVVNSDGSDLHKLVDKETNSFSALSMPKWSPNAKYIACHSGDNIILVDTANRKLTSITGKNSIADYSWSPDGNELAYFLHNGKGTLNIEKINVDSRQKVEMTKDLGFYPWQSLSWQP